MAFVRANIDGGSACVCDGVVLRERIESLGMDGIWAAFWVDGVWRSDTVLGRRCIRLVRLDKEELVSGKDLRTNLRRCWAACSMILCIRGLSVGGDI